MQNVILVIEDNDEVRENVKELLSLANYDVHVAINGKEGIAEAKRLHPDLILCDIMMPELDGYGVLRVVDNLPETAGTPFVFLTAKNELGDFRKAMDLGANDYLTKPFEGDELLHVIETRLSKDRMLKKRFSRSIEDVKEFMSGAGKILGTDILSIEHTIKNIRKKDIIYLEGDSAMSLYYVVKGEVKTFRTNEMGKEYITHIHNKEDFFGYNSLFDDSTRKESAAALEDSEIAFISKDDFYKLLYSNTAIAMKFIRLITDNLDEAEQRLLDLAYNSARKRVAEALVFVSKKYAMDEGKPIAISRETISSIAGIAQESVSRNLSDFREEGLIGNENGNIKILNLKKLENLRS